MKAKKKTSTPRQVYTAEQRETARKRYFRGFTLQEINQLMNIPVRTLEKWQIAEKWTLLKSHSDIMESAYNLRKQGKNCTEIGALLNVSRTTIWRYIKRYEKAKGTPGIN